MQQGLKKYYAKMDEHLSGLGLFRKKVARDASGLFRAVSEQLYFSQSYHQKIRQDCADFMRAERSKYEPVVEGSFEKYLQRLEDPKETVGQVEIKALSQLYRRCFVIYRFPGKLPTVISEDDFVEKVALCCSFRGHYDIVYPRSYPASAALCQSIVYELLYTQVFGLEEAELCPSMEAFRPGGHRYGNSPSECSDVDISYDTPEDRGQREEVEAGGAAEEKPRSVTGDVTLPAEAPPPSRLFLPYNVVRSLDGDVYRNLEFDVWLDTCKDMQKTDYMVFAGRQYFLGDKCQVRLEPEGKYCNAFIQEVGTHSSAVTVFIEELGEKHLVPLTDLKPVNPVPARNAAAPARKRDLDPDSHGHRHHRHHRHRYFRKSRGSSGVKGPELLMLPPSSYGGPAPSVLPPHFQSAGNPHPPPPLSHGAMTYDPYTPPHHHPPTFSPPLYGASRCSQWQLAVALNEECQFGFPAEAAEELRQEHVGQRPAVAPPPAMGATPPPPGSSYRVQRGSEPLPPAPPPGNTPVCSEEEDQEDRSTVEDEAEYTEEYIDSTQDQSYQTSGVNTPPEPSTNQDEQEGGLADSPTRSDMTYSHTQQVVKPLTVISSSPSSPSSRVPAAAHLPPAAHTQTHSVATAIPAASPWLVNELGEPLCSVVAPPFYSYNPNGSDLPQDRRVLQYYFNLGVQSWQQQQVYPSASPEPPYSYQHYPPYLSQEPPLHGPAPSMEGHSPFRIGHAPPGSTPSSTLLYPSQTPLAPPPLQRRPYEAPPTATYLTSAPPLPISCPPLPRPLLLPLPPPSAHWGGLPTVYCPAPNSAPSMEGHSPFCTGHSPPGSTPSSTLLYPSQTPLAPPPLQRRPYEAPPTATYLTSAPPLPISCPPLPRPLLLPLPPPSAHCGRLPTCPAPNPALVVGYITAPPPHHSATQYI